MFQLSDANLDVQVVPFGEVIILFDPPPKAMATNMPSSGDQQILFHEAIGVGGQLVQVIPLSEVIT